MKLTAWQIGFLVALPFVAAGAASGAVVVIANKTSQVAQLVIFEEGRPAKPLRLRAGVSRVLHVHPPAAVKVLSGKNHANDPPSAKPPAPPNADGKEYRLAPESAYFLYEKSAGIVGFHKIGLIDDPADEAQVALGQGRMPAPAADATQAADKEETTATHVHRITVKILVDDDERAARRVWEARLRGRLNEASQLFERQFGVRFEVAAVGTWKTSNSLEDFAATLGEFEQRVRPEPAQVAIGFTSQYRDPDGATHIGGTRIPLGGHILVREWSQHFSERERYELLVHELGHYLGAVHSPEADSVMRPVLGDRKALATSFAIGFDPLNALAIGLVAERLAEKKVGGLADLPPPVIARLAAIYGTLYQAMPDDAAAPQLLSLVGGRHMPLASHTFDRIGAPRGKGAARKKALGQHSPAADADAASIPADAAVSVERDAQPAAAPRAAQHKEPETDEKEPFVLATRQVLFTIVEAARHNAELNERFDGPDAPPARLTERADAPATLPDTTARDVLAALALDGDELTQLYVRAAAAEALKLPESQRVRAFCWGLAIGLERREEIRRYAVLGDFIRQVESDRERRLRLKVLGRPTWRRREDLSQHFAFSAAIMSTAGKRAAEAAGMAKELRDARSGGGFSFVDWAADLAGIALAERLNAGEIPLADLARDFMTADYLPDVAGLDEDLSWDDLTHKYGSTSDRRFRAVDADIRRNIERLYAFRRR